ncbi:MAG: arylesterase [Clostridiales bacterium]|mgnify:CR=1 FL=1|nr:arylesterase [Clostridiales bacterium]
MKHILIFGDSNTWGYDIATYDQATGLCERMPWDVRWVGRAQAILGPDYRLIEDALNARTVWVDDPYFDGRLGRASLAVALDAHAPLDLVVIHLGVNELKHMFALSPGMIALGIEKLVRMAQTPYYGYPVPRVLLIAPPPVKPGIGEMLYGFSYGPLAYGKSLKLGEEYRRVARAAGCAFLDAGALGLGLNDVDGLHYSRADHAILAVAAADAMRKALS